MTDPTICITNGKSAGVCRNGLRNTLCKESETQLGKCTKTG
jgi:hypothetical protein